MPQWLASYGDCICSNLGLIASVMAR